MIHMGMDQDLGELPLVAPQMIYDLRQKGHPQKINLNDQARVGAEVESLIAPGAIRGQRFVDELKKKTCPNLEERLTALEERVETLEWVMKSVLNKL